MEERQRRSSAGRPRSARATTGSPRRPSRRRGASASRASSARSCPRWGSGRPGRRGSAGPGPSSSPGSENSSSRFASVTTSARLDLADQAVQLGLGLARVHAHVDGAQVGGGEPEEDVPRVVPRGGQHEVALRDPVPAQPRGGPCRSAREPRRRCRSRPRRGATAGPGRRWPPPQRAVGWSRGPGGCGDLSGGATAASASCTVLRSRLKRSARNLASACCSCFQSFSTPARSCAERVAQVRSAHAERPCELPQRQRAVVVARRPRAVAARARRTA